MQEPRNSFTESEMPSTIEELKAFCLSKNMPLERMRFFIGEDYRGAKAFGIYQDEQGKFVVYKNKADGSRVVRYHGQDEAYAVRELYLKLQSEVQLRRESGVMGDRAVAHQPSRRSKFIGTAATILLVLVVGLIIDRLDDSPRRGYYCHDDDYYYYQDGWYGYDRAMQAWMLAETLDEAWLDTAQDYYEGEDYDDRYAFEPFEDSAYYKAETSDSFWDNDYGSWDMDSTNWSSDW